MSTVPAATRTMLPDEIAAPGAARLALAAVVISFAFFAAAVPFARIQLGQMAAFTPMYVATLVICDVITAVLLFGRFNFLRSPPLLVLACAYAFTAAMTASYVLMFPGLFSPSGLLGAGSQSTSAMYIFWHGGFPILVIAYAVLGGRLGRGYVIAAANARPTILVAVAAVLATVVAYTVFATAGHDSLPVFLVGDQTTALGHIVLSGDWLLSLAALIVLVRRRPYSVIDLWLMMVMCVWLFDLGLAAILNSGRYDLGWYAGRVYGVLAASSLLVMLLIENGNHYMRLIGVTAKLADANDALERLSLRDGLTNLANRRHFDTYLDSQLAVARRHDRPLALILYDIDSFKAYNDLHGHQAGDACLRQVAAAFRACCRRPADLAARYGGEEFAMILPDTELAGALLMAEAAREAVARLHIPHETSTTEPFVTISGGIAIAPGKAGATAVELILIADRALFEAKRLGRNRMISHAEQQMLNGELRVVALRG